MSHVHRYSMAIASFAALAVVLGPLSARAVEPNGAEPKVDAARLDRFVKADGEAFFALSLAIDMPAPASNAQNHDVVVMFDTSASQAGEHRQKAMASLESLLNRMGANTRVRLLAVDVNSVPMTEGFIAPRGTEMAAAIEQLKRRVPLGSTDMAAALSSAAESFSDESDRPRAAVYIGDGMSSADHLAEDEMRDTVERLAARRVPVSSYAVGPRLDNHLLAVVANHTGGVLAVDAEAMTPDQVGGYLARAAVETVIWPTEMRLPESMREVYPTPFPPLRRDRDTVVIGSGGGEEAMRIEMTAGESTLQWAATPGTANDDHAYLAQLVATARKDGGLGLPTLGSRGLAEAKRMLTAGVEQFNQLGEQAAAIGSYDQAEKLADAALRLDPNNPEARALRNHAIHARQAGGAPQVHELRLANFQDETGDRLELSGPAEDPAERAGALADDIAREREVFNQYLRNQVRNAVNDARGAMSENPEGAIASLKLMMEDVSRAPDVDPGARAQLRDQLEAALRAANTRAIEKTQRDLELQALEAARAERAQIARQLQIDDEMAAAMMERFNALLDEDRYLDALAEAERARELRPLSPALTGAVGTASLADHVHEAIELRHAQNEGFVASMRTVEESAISTPDNEPFIYPDAEVWLRLTEARRKYKQVDLAAKNPAEQRIASELEEPTVFEFLQLPLEDVVQYIKGLHNIEIQLDQRALTDVGLGTDTPVTRDLQGISLKSAMRLMLRDLGLTYVIQDEVLLITTEEEAESQMVTKVYPVADLVIPIVNIPLGGGGGGIGGGGGGFGGQGGGGGGFGGGGGGFGGGGGGFGGGGGGFFNVPRDAGRPFRAFAVKDELRIASDSDSNAAALNIAAVDQAPAKAIELAIPAGVDAEAAWHAYLSEHQASAAEIRATTRALVKQKDFPQVIALVRAALRNNHLQPWMYEALGLAMQADGRPVEEIERTLLSAVDLNGGGAQLMHLAAYMADNGLESRALKLYRQAAQRDPNRREPYVLGLKLARRVDDLSAIQWATVGILGQPWHEEEEAIWRSARRVAQATIERLSEAGRQDESRQYASQLAEALIRDCIVVVSWTGDADIDLAVEEPSGTLCSFSNPRSPAGGVLLHRTVKQFTDNPSDGLSETYVCPKGFDGVYRVMLHRAWGKPTAGRVTVDVYTNYRDENAGHERQQIELGDDPAAVVFELAQGRRTDLLEEQQVANAANAQLAIGREILAQQMAAISDSDILRAFVADRQQAQDGLDFFRRGAVGFQPVIITLPQGASMTATAVVSADRRYVRVTASPIFSQITNVTIFNTAGGDEMQGNIPPGGGLGGAAGG